MKAILILLTTLCLFSVSIFPQSSEELMKDRSAQLHEAIKSKDNAFHIKFIKNNYSKKFLEQYEMSMHTGMLERVNKNFGDSKVISTTVKNKENKLVMVIENNRNKHNVDIIISFDKDDNYKINGIDIDAGEM